MENTRLLGLYQAMNNLQNDYGTLPDAESKLASAIEEFLLCTNGASSEFLDCLEGIHKELAKYAPNNNMFNLFMMESRGKLSDLSIAITSYFAAEGSVSRPLFLLANLKVACTMRGLVSAAELIGSIEHHLEAELPSKTPTLKALAVLESLIEDPHQDREVYDEIYSILGGEVAAPTSSLDNADDTGEHDLLQERPLNDEYINPFMRRETVAQDVLEQRILIVDDEKMIAATVGFVLSDLDLPIDIVSDGAAALDRLNEHPYSLVISDIEMPNFDGFSLIGAMKNDFQFSDVPLVFMSNKEAYRELALELGATDFFLKGSIGAEELLEKISAVLKTAPFVPQRDD